MKSLMRRSIAGTMARRSITLGKSRCAFWMRFHSLCPASVPTTRPICTITTGSVASRQSRRSARMNFFTRCVNNGALAPFVSLSP
jgi:hypothetical protein